MLTTPCGLDKMDHPATKSHAFTWKNLYLAIGILLILDYGATLAFARPSPSIEEGRQHLHNNLVAHAVPIDDINADLPFASVRHLYATHPNSAVHDARKQAAGQAAKRTSAQSGQPVHVAESVNQSDVVQHPHKLFFGGPFTGAAIRAVAGLVSLAANKICKFIDDAYPDKTTAQQVGVYACYGGATLFGVFSLFTAGRNLYRIQQAADVVSQTTEVAGAAFELSTVVAAGVTPRQPEGTFERHFVDVHELMKDEFETHRLAIRVAEKGYKYEAAGLMSTIRPVSLKNKLNQTSHLWQDFHDGQIRKTHILTRFDVKMTDANMKRDYCDSSNNETDEDPQASLCASGANEGFTGVYDSFDMFASESDYEAVDAGMGDSEYADEVAHDAGQLMYLGGTSGVCIYPSVNNQTALTIFSALEIDGQPSDTYKNCPSLDDD